MNGFVWLDVHDDVRLLAGKLARRGISQRVAKVGTAASCRRRPALARHGIERVALQAVEVGGDLARIRGPAEVSSTPWRVRWNSCTPRKLSSDEIWRDTALCVSDSSPHACSSGGARPPRSNSRLAAWEFYGTWVGQRIGKASMHQDMHNTHVWVRINRLRKARQESTMSHIHLAPITGAHLRGL
jgi:hypothetical protein